MSGHDPEIEELRDKVHCAVVLERTPPPWKLDRKESTRLSLKYRRGKGEILIVSHAGRGWWDPTSDVFRRRLALKSAAAAAQNLLHRREDEAALRDAVALGKPGQEFGPAGRVYAAFRMLAVPAMSSGQGFLLPTSAPSPQTNATPEARLVAALEPYECRLRESGDLQ